MAHLVDGGRRGRNHRSTSPDASRVTVVRRLASRETLSIVKFLGYGWSEQRSRPAVHDQVVAALAAARHTGWDGLLAEQRTFLDEFWEGADVELDGDPKCSRRCGSRCSTCCRPAPAPSAGPSRPRA